MTFQKFSEYLSKLEKTTKRLEMTEILASLFCEIDESEISFVCYLLQGRLAPLYEPIEFGIADKFVIRAIVNAYNTDIEKVNAEFSNSGDLGTVAFSLYKGKTKNPEISEIYNKLSEIPKINGTGSQEVKINKLTQLLNSVDNLSAKYLVRMVLGKLRLGFSDMTIIDALSWMISGDKSLHDSLEDAYDVRPDIGWIAESVKKTGIKFTKNITAKIGVPILSSLCQRLKSADEMINKMGTVQVEPKYDGVRVQIHIHSNERKNKSSYSTFSRNLENTTEMFPELHIAKKYIKAQDVILDSEAVGIDPKSGKILPFQETTTRKRKHDIEQTSLLVPLRFYVFDILYKNGEDLLNYELDKRREILEKTIIEGPLFTISPKIVTNNPDEIRAFHKHQLDSSLEGVIVKKLKSKYEPGRRGFSWVKFKESEGKTGKLTDTVDAVVMGYYLGEGKRTAFGIGAFLVGVVKDEKIYTLTKIGTGVTDELWKELKQKLKELETKNKPESYQNVDKSLLPDFWVVPHLIVEIAGDDMTKSPYHSAGYAIRFPRLIKIRNDKSLTSATTLSEIITMYNNQ